MHTCSTIILHCIDFRFGVDIKQFLQRENMLGDIDVVSIAGAVKNLVNPQVPSDAEFVMRQLEISKRLHGVCDVILMNHTDCGAYGGAKAFKNPEEERERHAEDLRKAAAMIREKFSDLNVRLFLAHWGEPIRFEEISVA